MIMPLNRGKIRHPSADMTAGHNIPIEIDEQIDSVEQPGRRENLEIAVNLRGAAGRRSMHPRKFVRRVGKKIVNAGDCRYEFSEAGTIHRV